MEAELDLVPGQLLWAIARSGRRLRELRRELPELDSWLAGETTPTAAEAERFSALTATPLVTILHCDTTDRFLDLPDHRRWGQRPLVHRERAAPDVAGVYLDLLAKQDWHGETLGGGDPLAALGRQHTTAMPETAGAQARRLLGLPHVCPGDPRAELARHVAGLRQLDILVLWGGHVGADATRPVAPVDVRGIAHHDWHGPGLYLNTHDDPRTAIVVLYQMLGLLLVAASGITNTVFSLNERPAGAAAGWAARFAAEVLLPGAEMAKVNPDKVMEPAYLHHLADRHVVSQGYLADRIAHLNPDGRVPYGFRTRWSRQHQGVDLLAPRWQGKFATVVTAKEREETMGRDFVRAVGMGYQHGKLDLHEAARLLNTAGGRGAAAT